MNDFKEWLSDYLRYFLLGFAILAVVAIAILGITIYKKVVDPAPQTRQESESGEISTEDDTDAVGESSTEKETGTEQESENGTTEATGSEAETGTEADTTEGSTEAGSEGESENTGTTEAEDDPEYLKLTTGVNLRSGPGTDYDVIDSFEAGRTVKFLGKAGDWYKVRVAGQDGYMSAQYLTEVAYEAGMENEVETEKQTEAPEPIYKTLKASCYLRADTSKESEILGTYYTGATVQFIEDVGGWYKVIVDGVTGYMGAQFF